MNHFLRIDSRGYVTGYSFSDSQPGDEYQIFDASKDLAYTMSGEHMYRLVGDDFVESDIPRRPPQPWMSFLDGQWVDARTPEQRAANAREQRNRLLTESDWTQLPDVNLATKAAWATYRQALRDITDQPGYPLDVTWPTPPN